MAETLSAFGGAVLLTLGTLLPIINAPGLAPVFLSMTPGAAETTRARLARRIARTSFVLLIGAMLVGSYVLNFFGLSLAVVKIAGGLLVSSAGWHLFRAEQSTDADLVAASPAPAARFESLGFYPLTFPLTVGPGSLSAAVTLGAGVRMQGISQVSPVVGAVAGIALVSLVIYLCYRYATRVLGVLGSTGTVVLLRLSAFILLAVGVQIFTDGLVERFAILQSP